MDKHHIYRDSLQKYNASKDKEHALNVILNDVLTRDSLSDAEKEWVLKSIELKLSEPPVIKGFMLLQESYDNKFLLLMISDALAALKKGDQNK